MRIKIQTPEGLKSFQSAGDRCVIGRGDDADIQLVSHEISRKHLLLYKTSQGFAAQDLGTTNGTYMAGHRLDPEQPVQVRPEVQVHMGPFVVWIEEPAEKPERDLHFEKLTELRQRLHRELLSSLDLQKLDARHIDDGSVRPEADAILRELVPKVREEIPPGTSEERLIAEVLDEALGLGPLQDLLRDDEVSEVMVVSRDQIFVERNGNITLTDLRFTSDESLKAIIERIVAPIGRHVDESSPMVDARLKDGSRVNAVIPPVALKGPCITIRKFKKDPLTIKDLIRFGSITPEVARFLERCSVGKKNVIISGGTGSGKTTLLNVLSSFIPEDERVVTVEDAAELQLRQEHVVSLEARPPNAEGRGEISIRDLVKNALRMRPDRIVVGECRGGEAIDMLQAMNTGHEGSLTTGHANTPTDMLSRLEMMVLTGGIDLPVSVIRAQIATAINLVVQIRRFADGARRITHVSEVVGMEQGELIVEDIFRYQVVQLEDGSRTGKTIRTGYLPTFLPEFVEKKIITDGVFL